MVHQYKNNGYNILLDVNSGSVHVVDELVYDMIPYYKERGLEETVWRIAIRRRRSVRRRRIWKN